MSNIGTLRREGTVLLPDSGITDVELPNITQNGSPVVSLNTLDTDPTLSANSDIIVASQKAIKTYSDTKTPLSYLDTDGTLAANSDTKIASQKATKTYVDSKLGIKTVFFNIIQDSANLGNFRVDATGAGGTGRTNFAIPNDFATLASCHMIGVPGTTVTTSNVVFHTEYGTIGEATNFHSQSQGATSRSLVANQIYAFDISDILTSLAAGDFVGLRTAHGAGTGTISYLGVKLRYNS